MANLTNKANTLTRGPNTAQTTGQERLADLQEQRAATIEQRKQDSYLFRVEHVLQSTDLKDLRFATLGSSYHNGLVSLERSGRVFDGNASQVIRLEFNLKDNGTGPSIKVFQAERIAKKDTLLAVTIPKNLLRIHQTLKDEYTIALAELGRFEDALSKGQGLENAIVKPRVGKVSLANQKGFDVTVRVPATFMVDGSDQKVALNFDCCFRTNKEYRPEAFRLMVSAPSTTGGSRVIAGNTIMSSLGNTTIVDSAAQKALQAKLKSMFSKL